MRENTVAPSEQTKRWYAVYTSCRHEKRVARHLKHREVEHYLPLYQAERKWKNGSRAMLGLPLFPGYVFVRICADARVSVLETPGVVSIVGTASRPAPLPDCEVEALRVGLDPNRVEPHPLLTTGERVRIKSGALSGIEGIVVRRKSGFRVVLTLDLLMQSIAIEVDGEGVEPVYTSSPLKLEVKDQKVEQAQRVPLNEFPCLDSYPDCSQMLFSGASVARR